MMVRKRRNRKWLYWVVFVVLAILAAGAGYKVWEVYFREEKVAQEVSGGTDEPVEKPVEKVEDELEVSEEREEEVTELEIPTKPQYDGTNPNTQSGLTGVVTYAGVNDGVLMVRVNIDQFLTEGNCSLVLAKDGASLYTETVRVVDSAATATCEGFNIQTEKIGASGNIGIRIMIKSGDKSGIIEGEVEI